MNMQIRFNLCKIQGHEGCKLTHICIFTACKGITRSMCYKCLKQNNHRHDYEYNFIECENFSKHFQNSKSPQIELRLQSQHGNYAKLNYLKKIYQNDFDDLGWSQEILKKQKKILLKAKEIIKDLVKSYQKEMEQVQLLEKIYLQLMNDGLLSLDDEQLDTLLDDQFKFINQEIEYYNQLNLSLNKLDKYCQLEEEQSENQQKIRQIQKKLRRINDYLDIQQYSIDGKEFMLESYDRIYFQKKDRYFAIYDFYFQDYHLQKLKIRKQQNLNVNRQLNTRILRSINFDPSFNYCMIQSKDKLDAYLYTLKICKQLTLVKKLLIKEYIKEFYVSNNNIILLLQDLIFVKVINIKNELINEIKLECPQDLKIKYGEKQNIFKNTIFCYGSIRNIIAIEDFGVKFYQETQKQRLFSTHIGTKLQSMKFINEDQQLLTLDQKQNYRIWQIDYSNLKMTLINKIESYSYYIDINELNFTNTYGSGGIQILDRNHNLWYSIKPSETDKDHRIKITKHLIIIERRVGAQIIKRRSIGNYQTLEYDY